jgi:hypothetical protein
MREIPTMVEHVASEMYDAWCRIDGEGEGTPPFFELGHDHREALKTMARAAINAMRRPPFEAEYSAGIAVMDSLKKDSSYRAAFTEGLGAMIESILDQDDAS